MKDKAMIQPTFFSTLARVIALIAFLSLAIAAAPAADEAGEHENHSTHTKPASSIEDQLADLRAQVAKLESALAKNHQEHAAQAESHSDHSEHAAMVASGGGKGSGMKMGMTPMGMGMQDKGMAMGGQAREMGMEMPMGMGMSMSDKGMTTGEQGREMGMQMMKMGMGMGQMHKMGRMPDASLTVTALPGFPGASHLYHIGSTGFFLDHAEHLNLAPEQLKALNQIREKAFLEQSAFDRQIEQAEEELWTLTAADSPDAKKIETKLTEIGEKTASQRLAFIRAVGSATEVLSDAQRETLTSGGETTAADAASHSH